MDKRYIVISLFVIFVIAFHFYSNYIAKRGRENFKKFNQSQIVGPIKGIKTGGGEVFITIRHDSTEFSFFPKTSKHNNNQIFEYIAEKGDSVFKAPFSDTLYLFKEEETYKYTFQKIE